MSITGDSSAQDDLAHLEGLGRAVPQKGGVPTGRTAGAEGDSYRAALDQVLGKYGSMSAFQQAIDGGGAAPRASSGLTASDMAVPAPSQPQAPDEITISGQPVAGFKELPARALAVPSAYPAQVRAPGVPDERTIEGAPNPQPRADLQRIPFARAGAFQAGPEMAQDGPPAANSPQAAPTGPQQADAAAGGAQGGFDADFPEQPAAGSSFDKDFPQQAQSIIPTPPMSVGEWKSYLRNTSAGRVISAFGDAWTEPGLTEQTQKWLRDAGMTNVLEEADGRTLGFGQGVARRFANAIRGANRDFLTKPLLATTAALDILNKTVEGAVGVLGQMRKESDDEPASKVGGFSLPDISPEHVLGKAAGPLAELIEAEWSSMGQMLPHGPRLPVHVAESRAAGVIGEGEGGYFNTVEPSDQELSARATAQAESGPPPGEVAPAAEEAAAEAAAAPAPAPPTVHDIAREIDPIIVGRRDDLESRRQTYRSWLDDLASEREQAVQDNPPEAIAAVDRDIADLERKRDNAGNRTRGRWEKELDDAQERREALVQEHLAADTPAMTKVRRDLLDVTHRLWDLGPDLRRVYGEAAQRVPAEPEPVAEPPGAPEGAAIPPLAERQPAESAAAPLDTREAAPGTTQAAAEAPAAAAPRPHEEQVRAIADDVAKRLAAIGQDAQVSRAISEIWAARYGVRAAQLGLQPEELWAREGKQYEFRLGNKRAAPKQVEFAQGAEEAEPVRARIPIDRIMHGESALPGGKLTEPGAVDRIQDYASRETPLPAIEVVSSGDPDHPWMVADGSHRLEAAKMRGDTHIDVMVSPHDGEGLALLREDGNTLYSGKRGNVEFLEDGKRIITLMRDADASTFMHESGHVFLEDLIADAGRPEAPAQLKADAETALKWMGVTRDEFVNRPMKRGRRQVPRNVRTGHEQFARGFERYLMEGVAPSRALARVFAQFRKWLTAIYESVSRLRSPINDDIRDVFDRLLAKEPERVTIAPDRGLAAGIADLHEADADGTAGADMQPVHDLAHAEAAADVNANHPELAGELHLDAEAGAGAAQRAGDDGRGAAAGSVGGQAGGVPQPGALVSRAGQNVPQGLGPPRLERYGPPRASGLYVKVPRRPPSLADWIKSKGGVVDPAGEVKALGVKRPGLIKPDGSSLDDLALRAWEQGFFPEWSERPTENDLLRKLDEDLHGNHQWSDHDRDEVAEYQDALARNHEVDRIAAELDVNQKGLSYEAFWDKVAERASEERRDKEIDERRLAAGLDGDLDEARRLSDEYDREQGREGVAGLAPEGQGAGGPAGGARGGEGAAGEGRPAGAGAGDVEEGAGPGGGIAGPEGGNAAPRRVRSSDGELVDKAGNIRLDLLGAPDDVDAALRQIALANDQFAADRFGAEGHQLHDQIFAARVLVKRLGDDMVEKMKAAGAADSDEAALLAYKDAANRLTMATRRLATLTHAWGYAGQAFKDHWGLPDNAAALDMSQMAERTKGMTFNQLRQEAQLQMQLEPNQRARFLSQTRSTAWQKARAMYIEYFVNNLISGPITHMAYTIGNETMNLWRGLIQMPAAAGLSFLRGRGAGDRIYLSETKALLYSHTKGAADGWAAAVKAFKTDTTQLLPGELASMTPRDRMAWEERNGPNAGAIPGVLGKAIRLPSRSVKSIHAFGRGIIYAQEIYRRAVRSGLDRGLEGDALNSHIAQYLTRPPHADMVAASEEATRGVMMQSAKYGTAFWHIKQAVDKNVVAKTIAPFMQIGANLLHGGFIEHTPLGLLDDVVRADLLGKNGKVRQDIAASKMLSGVALSTAVVGFTLNGIMTGGGPHDQKQRALLMAQGWQPYSLKIGGRYIPYRKYLGALGPLVAGVADMAEISHTAKEGDYASAAWAAVGGLAEVIADESWMRGVSNLVNAARNYDTAIGERYVRDLAMDFLPYHVGSSQIARLIDDKARRVSDWTSAAKASTPWLSQSLPPRYDIIGRPIASHLMVSPTNVDDNPVLAAMKEAQFYPASVPRTIRGVKLTDAQYDRFSRLAGTYARQALEPFVGMSEWQRVPAHIRHNQIKNTFEQSRERARQVLIAENRDGPNDIWRQSLELKKARTRSLDEPPVE